MLVLSRRAQERISFPDVGITVHFLRIQSGSAKVGIDAPVQIKIIRDEVSPEEAEDAKKVRGEFLRLPRRVRHALRNELHTVSVGLHLYKEQMRLGMREDADETFETIQGALRRVDENQALQRPAPFTEGATVHPACAVLIVEDEDNERELLAAVLRLKGYEVACVGDGVEALEYLERHETPGVILMDMKLPRRDGPWTVRRIRADSHHRHARVFAVSGTSPAENGLSTGRQGVDHWFPKPINVDSLFEFLTAELTTLGSPGGSARRSSIRGSLYVC